MAHTTQNEKDLMVEIRWIRPTKLCAIFDLFLAILAYIIALASDRWVYDLKGSLYYVSLYSQCYEVGKAHQSIDLACSTQTLFGRGDAVLDSASNFRSGLDCSLRSKYAKLMAESDGEEFECIDIAEKLPWASSANPNTGHHTWTIILLFIALFGCSVCFLAAVVVYLRSDKNSDRNNSVFRIVGLVLLGMGCLGLISVIVFGVGFPTAVPYPSDWKFAWGFGFAFAATILTFIAGLLFFFGTTWKRDAYNKKKTFSLW